MSKVQEADNYSVSPNNAKLNVSGFAFVMVNNVTPQEKDEELDIELTITISPDFNSNNSIDFFETDWSTCDGISYFDPA